MIFVRECLCVGWLGAENNKWKRKNRRRKSTKSFVGGPSGKTQNIEMCQSIQSIAATFSHSHTHTPTPEMRTQSPFLTSLLIRLTVFTQVLTETHTHGLGHCTDVRQCLNATHRTWIFQQRKLWLVSHVSRISTHRTEFVGQCLLFSFDWIRIVVGGKTRRRHSG